jgi:membrane-bound lytic murein transglycosylase MltF
LAAVLVTAACATEPAPPAANVTPAAPTGSAPAAPTADAPSSGPDDAMIEAATRPWTGDLDGMIERRMIRVLTTHSKVNYFVDSGTQRGLIYDAFRLFEEDLNKELKRKNLRVQVLFIPVAHDELVPALLAGRGDIVASGTLMTDWRREQVDFSVATQTNVSSIIVSGPDEPPIKTVEDLGGREVYLRMSDVSTHGVEAFNQKLAAAGRPPVKIVPAPEVLADEDLLEMVAAGLVPMTLVDDYRAEFWHGVYPTLVINTSAPIRTGMQTGMMVRRNSPQLLKTLNTFLARYPEGSLRRNLLLQEYLKGRKHVNNARAQAEVARLQGTLKLFQKYGDQYKLDFLLMAAQGYQESGLNQNAQSQVGAIGIMQVMPATGKELAVGDITQLEPNIHAGVKYVRQLVDRYLGNEPMDDLNKALFAFASYNAGPGRIRELRQRAAKRGLNPNLWFNNVEVVVAEVVGRETVQYVSNIYKYYLAYSMVMEQRERQDAARQQLKKSSQ